MNIIVYILLFYIGFYYYRLAENYKKRKWLYAILGVFFSVFGFFSNIIYVRLFKMNNFDESDIANLSLKSISMGVLFAFVLFHVINFIWKKNK